MNIPFEVAAIYSGTPIVKNLFSTTDNLVLAGIITAGALADIAGLYDIVRPTGSFWLTGFSIVADAAAKVELGVVDASGDFVKLYPTVATQAVGGGMVRRFDSSGPLFVSLSPYTTLYPAVRVTGAANGTITVTGDIGCQARAA